MISAVASSSSSSSMLSPKKYDVFLSFRGEDTRRNFTSHLYEALKQKKVETYIDEHLEKGDEISPALIKAIEDSHVSIVVFSKNYASSKWCLVELIKILDCKKDRGQIVIPVFYEIDPSDVRKQTGSYEQAFAKHEGEPSCNKWKTALTEAANLAGWDSRTYRTDPELLKDIVADVLQKLPPRYQNQRKGLVGIEEHCKHIESLLKIGPTEVRTLGIWGMGGIGKTALATTLYDKLSHEFEGSSFLSNVNEKSDKLENHCFGNSDMSTLRGKKALIVLDDVATSEHLEKLKVDYDFLEPGSRVIVTTRNREILGPNDEIYQVKELSSHHSVQLFCLTVFGEKQPKEGYEDLSERVLSYCKGIPLALKVMGASLRRKSKEAWESELRKLQKISSMEIHTVLKLSYDGLDHSQKDIFLDIACFFKGRERDWVTRVLDAFDFFAASGIEVLLDKALITISEGNHIEMHDLIQEMGWEIVRQECIKDPGRQSRLWRQEEVQNILKYNRASGKCNFFYLIKGTDVVEGIILSLRKLTEALRLSFDFLAKMTNLRFLQFYDGWDDYGSKVPVPTGFESLPDKLRYLHWEGFCLESLPLNFCAEQLVELYMPFSKLKKLWDGVQNLVNLKIIGLQGSKDLIEVPDLSKAEKLEIVNLSFCVSLLQLHVYSKSLQGLNAKNCSSLKEFSVTSEEITELNLADTAICELPPSIWQKKKLAFLVLNGCKNLKFFGNEIVHLLSSKRLDLSQTNIERLSALPPSLKYLMAEGCTSLETNFTQHLVLHHMIQSRIPYLHKHPSNPGYYNNHECFFFPGDRITKACGFCTGDSSITIPYLPKSDLHGFIYCIIFSEGIYGKRSSVLSCSINQDGIQVGQDQKTIYIPDLFLDHVLFWYHDIRQFDRIREVCDHFSDLTISFEHKHLFRGVKITWGIKECGVFPVYARASGFKVVGSNSKETFECESITQISNNESQPRPRAIRVEAGVRGSNNENEEDRSNFLQQKSMRTSP
ncbi:hypothetical protein JHK85_050670 [Glycine max]|nr:hypothetical protein JHK85_050670 [Glycine max]